MNNRLRHSSKRSRQLGAVALEYILIAALVAIALIGAFRVWGKSMKSMFTQTSGRGVPLKPL